MSVLKFNIINNQYSSAGLAPPTACPKAIDACAIASASERCGASDAGKA